MPIRRRTVLKTAAALPAAAQTVSSNFNPVFPPNIVRPWIGADFWANPLQDWQLSDGRLECLISGGDRNVSILTREILPGSGGFTLTAEIGRHIADTAPLTAGFAGFRIGARGNFNDFRDTAIRGVGIDAGLATDCRLFISDLPADAPRLTVPGSPVKLELTYKTGTLTLRAFDIAGTLLGETSRPNIPAEDVAGGIALVSHAGPIETRQPRRAVDTGFNSRRGTGREGNVRFWFRNISLSGPQVARRNERHFGPILFNQYTVSRGTLKMLVQCAPLDAGPLELELQTRILRTNRWLPAAKATLEPNSSTALFRIDRWDDTTHAPYRVLLRYLGETHALSGTITQNPAAKNRLVIGALTCQGDFGYPHANIFKNLTHHKPDILFFTGDQLYERNGDYGNQLEPPPAARLDYLRKWFMFGWAWGPMTRNVPCLCLPDDHDVYHGNLWGAGGRKAVGQGQPAQDSGGYKMPADWVNMVQRTQTAHMPDPPDPAPVAQAITVHYCHYQWGGLSFAVLEDRKWKSAPKEFLPNAKIVNGWPQNTSWNAAKDGDVPGAQLLGPRQEAFLEQWARDWSGGTFMKAAVTATIFCNLATLPPPATTDSVTSTLPILPLGGFAPGEIPTTDHDSNAWPQTPRNRSLKSMRKALAFHIAGDQHLASTVQYGIDNHNDAAFAICTPAISNIFPRRWFPPTPGRNPKPHSTKNTGEFLDGFGNKMTVHAVANPATFGVPPAALNNRAIGYGIIEVFRDTRKITLTNWPAWVDASHPNAEPYQGWPITIHQTDNGLPNSGWTLPPITLNAADPLPVIEVTKEDTGELIYNFRLHAPTFTPPVPAPGAYTIRLHDPDTKTEKILRNQQAVKA